MLDTAFGGGQGVSITGIRVYKQTWKIFELCNFLKVKCQGSSIFLPHYFVPTLWTGWARTNTWSHVFTVDLSYVGRCPRWWRHRVKQARRSPCSPRSCLLPGKTEIPLKTWESKNENAVHETNNQREENSHFAFYSRGYVLELFWSNHYTTEKPIGPTLKYHSIPNTHKSASHTVDTCQLNEYGVQIIFKGRRLEGPFKSI